MIKTPPVQFFRTLAFGFGFAVLCLQSVMAFDEATLEKARGQTVYWHAWGGEPRINAYIAWVGEQVEDRYGINLRQVKVTDTGHVVQQVLAEKAAGKLENGSVDLVWVNGENFATMKSQGLLQADDWVTELPHFKYVDVEGKPSVIKDFTVATDGLEAPWGMAQLIFYYDTARTKSPPKSASDLLQWAKQNPGKFTYAQPPDFLGHTFLKQMLYDLIADPTILQSKVDAAQFETQTEPLWNFLDQLHPVSWRKGQVFAQNSASLRTLFSDSEIEIGYVFNPGDPSSAIANGELPDTVRSYVFESGSLGNTHFVAIPFNANAPEAAKVVADFLMSPEAQARKQDTDVWGDPTVLKVSALSVEDKALFEALDLGIATLTPDQLGSIHPEPHPSWVKALEEGWAKRYGVQN